MDKTLFRFRERSFVQAAGFAQRFDPRAKIIAAAGYSFFVALIQDGAAAGFALCGAFLTAVVFRLPFVPVVRRLLWANLFIVFLWFFLPFSSNGEPLGSIGPLVLYRQGIMLALLISVKANAILLVFLSLVATTPVIAMGHAMGTLGIPEKLVFLLLFTYRYIHVMEQERQRLRDAVTVRGFRPRTNLHTYKTFGYFLGMLLVRSFSRAERVRQAMICRGFKGSFHSLEQFRFTMADGMLLLIFGFFLVGVACIQWPGISY